MWWSSQNRIVLSFFVRQTTDYNGLRQKHLDSARGRESSLFVVTTLTSIGFVIDFRISFIDRFFFYWRNYVYWMEDILTQDTISFNYVGKWLTLMLRIAIHSWTIKQWMSHCYSFIDFCMTSCRLQHGQVSSWKVFSKLCRKCEYESPITSIPKKNNSSIFATRTRRDCVHLLSVLYYVTEVAKLL